MFFKTFGLGKSLYLYYEFIFLILQGRWFSSERSSDIDVKKLAYEEKG